MEYIYFFLNITLKMIWEKDFKMKNELNNNVLMGKTKEFIFNESIAIFNLENNLIKSEILKNKYFFKLFHKTKIHDKLNLIIRKRGSIVILENLRNEKYIDELKKKIEQLEKMLNIPFIILIFKEKNYYYKPFGGANIFLNCIFRKNGQKINKKKSIYIGSEAGRLYNNYYNKNDKTCIDRIMAEKMKIAFDVPENFFFNNQHNYDFTWGYLHDVVYKKYIKNLINKESKENKKIYKNICNKIINHNFNGKYKKIVIMIIGNFFSGKTYLSKELAKLTKKKIKYIDVASLKNFSNIKTILEELYKNADIIFIEGRIYKNKQRNFIYETLNDKNSKNIIIELITPIEICIYFNCMHLEMKKSNKGKIISRNSFSMYKNNFEDILKFDFKKNQKLDKTIYSYFKYFPVIRNIKELHYKYDI